MLCCIRTPGDMDGGDGLVIVMPVTGWMMGMALRARVAAGWCSLSDGCWIDMAGGIKGGDDEFSEKASATCTGCDGECSGEPLDTDDRSEDALWIETRSVSVNKPGQNSMSSSRSKDRPASNFIRKAVSCTVSASSLTLRAWRKCLEGFCDMESRGALRLRPPW